MKKISLLENSRNGRNGFGHPDEGVERKVNITACQHIGVICVTPDQTVAKGVVGIVSGYIELHGRGAADRSFGIGIVRDAVKSRDGCLLLNRKMRIPDRRAA